MLYPKTCLLYYHTLFIYRYVFCQWCYTNDNSLSMKPSCDISMQLSIFITNITNIVYVLLSHQIQIQLMLMTLRVGSPIHKAPP